MKHCFKVKLITYCFRIFAALAFLFILCEFAAWAGPPFVTDDPEPVEYHHWESYFASQFEHTSGGTTGTAPHFDINYGIMPETHLNIVIPFAYSSLSGNSMLYGLGDIELGVKYRFVPETDSCPQLAIYPRLEFSTGDSSRGLGEGHATFFIPLWLQKSWGPWTAYGGGGFWYNNTGTGKNYWQTGWVLQRDISKELTLGAEIFNFSASEENEDAETGADIGAIININEKSHMLFSAGRDVSGPDTLFMYIAYQLTVGPG